MKVFNKIAVVGSVALIALYVYQWFIGHPERCHLLLFAAMALFARWFLNVRNEEVS